MTMTPAERFDELQILMPGTPDRVHHFLASDHTVMPWENAHEERNRYVEPVHDFFHKFRIDKTKLQRILNVCGEVGARWLSNRHYYWNRRHIESEAAEYGAAAEAARAFKDTHQGDDYLEAIQGTVETVSGGDEPLVEFNAHRAALVLRCDDVLRTNGKYKRRSWIDCHKMLRSLVRKVEMDSRSRSPEEILGITPARHNFPNFVFADRRFGDGRRFIQETDDSGRVVKQYREPLYQPIIPEFAGKGRSEQEQMIRDHIRREQERKRRQKDSRSE